MARWSNGIVTYELALLVVILTALFKPVTIARIPGWRRRKLYGPAISNGKILTGVINPPEEAREKIVERHGGGSCERIWEVNLRRHDVRTFHGSAFKSCLF